MLSNAHLRALTFVLRFHAVALIIKPNFCNARQPEPDPHRAGQPESASLTTRPLLHHNLHVGALSPRGHLHLKFRQPQLQSTILPI